ncbi:MAG: glycosyltransferase [Longimicrobiales bacterium]
MKVLIHGDGNIVYGAERQAGLLAQGLGARGHEVIFACPPNTPFAEFLRERGVATVHVRPRGNLDLFSAVRFSRWIRAERPDAFLATSWKRALSVGWAARRAGVPRIILRVGGTKAAGTRTGEWRVGRALRHYTDALVGNSRAITDFLAARFPFFPRHALNVVWNAVEPPDIANSMVRRELRMGSAPLVLAVGGLSANKAHHLLLDALTQMKQDDVHLAVAGWGAEAERLQQRTAELGLGARVHWLGHRHDVPKLLGAADVFVLTSRHEGTANALLEAMAAGVPVISTPIAGSEVALEAVAGRAPAGWLIPFGDAAALAETLERVLAAKRANASELNGRVEEARWRTHHWFSSARMVAGYETVLSGGHQRDDTANV